MREQFWNRTKSHKNHLDDQDDSTVSYWYNPRQMLLLVSGTVDQPTEKLSFEFMELRKSDLRNFLVINFKYAQNFYNDNLLVKMCL